MRALPLFLVPAVVAAQAPAPLPEAPLSAGEREQAQRLLAESRQALLKATDGLTPAQWTFKPAPDRWSIQECAQHIALVEQVIQSQVIAKGLAGPREPLRRADVTFTDAFLIAALPDRSHRFQAPERLRPAGGTATPEAVLGAFEATRKLLDADVKASAADWRARFGVHPALGTLDLYQWVLLAAGHTTRHVQQIEEVKRAPGFPAASR
ncbi:DinB family protein [Geothrix sp. 21YS21S-4]|uniref:DinB family protein n=1 Tax=Geothrix sp. 21YS21S-4 TaxID=3068889 RepID=UPI0027B8DA42|nr:DinB family protein [Geothrix sp. 21YS21S-4]